MYVNDEVEEVKGVEVEVLEGDIGEPCCEVAPCLRP